MFRGMRRKEKQLSNEASMELVNKGTYGVLATISENGYPYTTPLNYVYYKDCIYFHSAVEGHKLDNIKQCEKVSFCIASDVELLAEEFDTNYKSVVLFGTACEVFAEEKEQALFALIKKYSPDYTEKGKEYIKRSQKATRVVKIKIDHITGKAQ